MGTPTCMILGGTGHIGRQLVLSLLRAAHPVKLIVRDPQRAEDLADAGATVVRGDVFQPDELRSAFEPGQRLFVLNPPASPEQDTDAVERRSAAAILAAVDGIAFERIVMASTYGAQPGDSCGDLSVLYELEQGLSRHASPLCTNRAAYYFTNWDAALETARSDGVVHTVFAADFELPMVSPRDLAAQALKRLTDDPVEPGIRHVEGPRRYTPADVAAAFAAALGRDVTVQATPRPRWTEAFRALGFSAPAAASYARMTAATVDQQDRFPTDPLRGPTTLESHIEQRVAAGGGTATAR